MKTRTDSKQKFFGRRHNRQGVTLLFVVSMIVLFLLMGTTFMIVANEYRRASKPRLLNNLYRIDNQALVQQAFYELIRGPELANPASPLRTHDILADMYGYGFKATISGAPIVANIPGTLSSATPRLATDQFIELQLQDPVTGTINEFQNLLTGATAALSLDTGRYNGQVISFVSGDATGISTRILDYRVEDDGGGNLEHKFIIQVPRRDERGLFDITNLAQLSGDVIINGRAFGGVGAGEFDQDSALRPPRPGRPTVAALGPSALLPNRIGESLDDLIGRDNGGPPSRSGYLSFQIEDAAGNPQFNPLANLVGPNESYDGPDYQNMFLSGFDIDGNQIPSFYRPSLVTLHGDSEAGAPNNRHMFSAFDLDSSGATVELEVDTDNDGVLDAIWIDIGLPVQTTPDGIRYKPLVAYQVVDQDGRVNLNVAGNLSDQANGVAMTQGVGYGPAELAVRNGLLSPMDYSRILLGDGTFPGRYGPDNVPGGAGRDSWSTRKLFGYPIPLGAGTEGEMNGTLGGFFSGSAFDLAGRFPVNRVSDRPVPGGGPVVFPHPDLNDPDFNNSLPDLDFTNFVFASDTLVNSPYEANFAPAHLRGWEADDDDLLFGPLELERMLRPFDIDSNQLPGRLISLASGVVIDTALRSSVTTESYEVPMAPAAVQDPMGRLVRWSDLIKERLEAGGVAADELDNEMRDLLSPELLTGLKMDVNRVFGNGFDDDGNGVVDDPIIRDPANGSIVDGETNETFNADPEDLFGTPAMDLNNDFLTGTNDDLARHQFAKELYVLMLLTTEDSAPAFFGTGAVADIAYRTAVAQWCINVVDFRDPDSIHTPFEFDTNPWNGWDVDGDLTTDDVVGGVDPPDRAVVWGAERPELLLTETFASHDRRTQDLDTEPSGATTTDATPDEDFDSRLLPQTSVYLELYHPWTQGPNNQLLPAELGNGGVNLQQVDPDGNPVWRIGFRVQADDENFTRSVVFTDAAPGLTDGGEEFFTSLNIPVVAPGQYAVIGSVGNVPEAGSGVFRTTFGRLETSVEGDASTLLISETRSIALDPDNGQIFRNEWVPDPMDADMGMMVETFSNGIAVVIDGPRSLSVTDPTGGYVLLPDEQAQATESGDGLALMMPRDTPFDATNRDNDNEDANGNSDGDAIWRNGSTPNFRMVELQRLANPLAAFDAVTNPYLTIDKSSLDLVSFNGLTNDPTNSQMNRERVAGVTSTDTNLGSFERGENMAASTVPFGAELFSAGGNGIAEDGGGHNLGFMFEETFGLPNAEFQNAAGNFAWLTWNNRPYVSHLELTNVPISSPEDLTSDFAFEFPADFDVYEEFVDGNGDPTNPLRSKFGHLLNFYGSDDGGLSGNFYRLLDFLEVPSRYVGTEEWLSPTTFPNNPFNFVSNYRYPGKININTIPNDIVYNTLMGTDTATLNFDQFNASRWRANGFFRPYRNGTEGILSSGAAGIDDHVEAGLFRSDGASPRQPLFETNSNNGYFQNAMRQRLGNLTTTRSSVFAIWITVGYFEVDEDDVLMTNTTGTGPVGVEVGKDSGGAVRNRGFYLFDRSIPVAYEPGKNHNIERAILVESIIE